MNGFLDKAYGHKSGDEAVKLYDDWAASYEDELTQNGYATPGRCAAALAGLVEDLTAPVLDIGCGTGLSGLALRQAGFTTIDGIDPSPEMLKGARAKGAYRALTRNDPLAPLEYPEGTYTNAFAAGVLSPGLAPPETLDQVMAFLPVGGRLVFSLNDHAIADGAHEGRLREVIDAGLVDLEFKEYGVHIPGKGMKSYVYVIRKR